MLNLGYTYTKNYLLFIWISKLTGSFVFLFVESGHPTDGVAKLTDVEGDWFALSAVRMGEGVKAAGRIEQSLPLNLEFSNSPSFILNLGGGAFIGGKSRGYVFCHNIWHFPLQTIRHSSPGIHRARDVREGAFWQQLLWQVLHHFVIMALNSGNHQLLWNEGSYNSAIKWMSLTQSWSPAQS